MSHAVKVMLKILQDRIHQYVNGELPHVQAGFKKGRGNRDQIANIHWITKKQENSRKTSASALLTKLRPLTVCIIKTVEYSFSSVQFSAVTQLCPTLCDPMNYSISGLPVHHQIPELVQPHVH